jgi:hypothetical protein
MPVEKDIVAEHAELIGRVTVAWNDLNQILSILFEMLSGLPPEKANAIYSTPQSDRAQRDMLMAVAKIALEPHPSIWLPFKTCMEGINSLSSQRNAAIHTSWVLKIPGNEFAPSPILPKHKALKADFASQFQDLKAALHNKGFELLEIRKRLLDVGFTSPPQSY